MASDVGVHWETSNASSPHVEQLKQTRSDDSVIGTASNCRVWQEVYGTQVEFLPDRYESAAHGWMVVGPLLVPRRDSVVLAVAGSNVEEPGVLLVIVEIALAIVEASGLLVELKDKGVVAGDTVVTNAFEDMDASDVPPSVV